MSAAELGAAPAAATGVIDVAFTPADLRPTDIALVVDVLRAGSTVVAAFEAGFERVLCVADVEGARRLGGPGRALAGERECLPIEGFDFGNSPGAIAAAQVPDLVLCTTNGTPAVLAAAQCAAEVLIAALLNLEPVVAAVPQGADVTVVCSGTGGRFALEDAYLAGRLVALLRGSRSDAAVAAARIAESYPDAYTPLARSADARVLAATGQSADLAYCARENVSDLVPRLTGTDAGAAVLEAPDPSLSNRSRPMGKGEIFV